MIKRQFITAAYALLTYPGSCLADSIPAGTLLACSAPNGPVGLSIDYLEFQENYVVNRTSRSTSSVINLDPDNGWVSKPYALHDYKILVGKVTDYGYIEISRYNLSYVNGDNLYECKFIDKAEENQKISDRRKKFKL